MDLNRLEDVARYLGNPAQAYGAERMVCAEGKNKGCTVYDVRTGGGLQYQILADNAMDIGSLYYKGVNLHYLTKNGHQADPDTSDFFYSFPGGMLYTCGLMSAGDGNTDGGILHPIHGRIHSVPSERSGAEITEGNIVITGKMRESRYSGYCLELEREVRSPLGLSLIHISRRQRTDEFSRRPDAGELVFCDLCFCKKIAVPCSGVDIE